MSRRIKKLKVPACRPSIPINWDDVDRYIESGCPGTEVSSFLGCCPNTLYERCLQEKGVTYTVYAQSKRYRGDGMIRVKQMARALKGEGDTKMLIYLGKNRLGQSENPVVITERNAKIDEFLDILKGLKVAETGETQETSDG